ncbi:Protein of unknown function [Pyronema omphalodes CBS 100304]|uniref:Uncharacterized protein n=1 Tax=Pyronema omphalodes (strain CBS 100304) TaxID=1076935 RepID=U4LEH6_PYROM|nr:Protein of unknown function [Pyronema omphalodes CBS 100304]
MLRLKIPVTLTPIFPRKMQALQLARLWRSSGESFGSLSASFHPPRESQREFRKMSQYSELRRAGLNYGSLMMLTTMAARIHKDNKADVPGLPLDGWTTRLRAEKSTSTRLDAQLWQA